MKGNAWCVLAGAAVAVMLATQAAAADHKFEDIAGKWCTTGGSEQFDRENLIVVLTSNNGERRVFSILDYVYSDDKIEVKWTNKKGEKVHTFFGEFSSNGREMVQLESEHGPRRQFHRC